MVTLRSIEWFSLVGLVIGIVGCRDSREDEDAGATGLIGVSTDDATAGGPMGSGSTSASHESGESGEALCETILCGAQSQCCALGEECVVGSCLAACDSGVRCGPAQETCCPNDTVCLVDACVTPTGACTDSFDCDFGEFCEPTLGGCLPQLDDVQCEYAPQFEEFDVTVEWTFTSDEVISIPLVADIRGDAAPEVVANLTQKEGLSWRGGEVVVLNGQDGTEQLRIPNDPTNNRFGSHGRSTLGLADVSGDGRPDIIYAGRPSAGVSLIHAVDGEGNLLWSSHDANGTPHPILVENGAPSFANLDDDFEAEIVFGAAVLDHDGLVVWDEGGDGEGGRFGSNANYAGGISALADLTGDGYPEIVSGRHAWSVAWEDGSPPNVQLTTLWDDGRDDGYPAITDLDGNGTPEVILVASGTVRVLDGATGQLWCGVDPTGVTCDGNPAARTQPVAIPGGGLGGPPTVADFDGDGRPEVAAAGGSSYTVYDFYREGEDLHVAPGMPAPTLGETFVRWTKTTQDQSSNVTGSSVFDFQGDGAAEVVYQDECYMRVYAGTDGEVLLELESSSATIHEYPLVVDVDADGNSEIMVVANDSGTDCDALEDYTERRGIYVYGDTFDRWMKTRKVWTSHTYHVTNVTSSGHVPVSEVNNWTQPGLNNYRQNVQGAGVFNAPDLSVELSLGVAACKDARVELIATIRNDGALGVPAGVEVLLHEAGSTTPLATASTDAPLLPGSVTQFSWEVDAPAAPKTYFVSVDGDGDAASGIIEECNEGNNITDNVEAACPIAG